MFGMFVLMKVSRGPKFAFHLTIAPAILFCWKRGMGQVGWKASKRDCRSVFWNTHMYIYIYIYIHMDTHLQISNSKYIWTYFRGTNQWREWMPHIFLPHTTTRTGGQTSLDFGSGDLNQLINEAVVRTRVLSNTFLFSLKSRLLINKKRKRHKKPTVRFFFQWRTVSWFFFF